jgi:hypothetical protein
MIRKISLLLVIVIFAASPGLWAQENTGDTDNSDGKKKAFDYNVGFNLAYNVTPVKINDTGIKNSLVFSYAALELAVEMKDNLTMGIVAGFNRNYLKDTVSSVQLPVPVDFDREKSTSMVLGVNIGSEFLLPGDFSFRAGGKLLYFKLFENQFPLDTGTGTATFKNSFYLLNLELPAQYDGFSSFTIFVGPHLNLVSGKYTAAETADLEEAEESYNYSQRKAFGLSCGANFDLGSHFTVDAKLSLISTTSFSLKIFYVF